MNSVFTICTVSVQESCTDNRALQLAAHKLSRGTSLPLLASKYTIKKSGSNAFESRPFHRHSPADECDCDVEVEYPSRVSSRSIRGGWCQRAGATLVLTRYVDQGAVSQPSDRIRKMLRDDGYVRRISDSGRLSSFRLWGQGGRALVQVVARRISTSKSRGLTLQRVIRAWTYSPRPHGSGSRLKGQIGHCNWYFATLDMRKGLSIYCMERFPGHLYNFGQPLGSCFCASV